jgi:hypothetical protein
MVGLTQTESNKSWRTNRPYAFQFHFNIPSTAPVGAHQTFVLLNCFTRLLAMVGLLRPMRFAISL